MYRGSIDKTRMFNLKKRCRLCKKYTDVDAGAQHPVGYFCNNDHALKWIFEKRNKSAKLVAKKQHLNQKREFRLSDVKHQHKLTQASFNRMRVLEELAWFSKKGVEPYCISCGKTNMDWCCGHFKTVGSSGSLRYDRKNTFLQCNWYCNMNKSGNIEGCTNTHGYKKGLSLRFGKEGEEIIDYCELNQSSVKKWTGIELKSIRREFSKRASDLRKLVV